MAGTENRLNFTKRAIEKLPAPAKGRIYYHDTKHPGLLLCITASGTRTFYFRKRVDRQTVRHRLGRVDELTVEQARKQADRLKVAIADGKNPQATKRAKRGEMTFGELHEAWIDLHVRPKRAAKTLHEYERIFKANLRPWANRGVSDITPSGMLRLHLRIGKENPYLANRVLSQIRAVFNWARKEPLKLKIPNPTNDIEKFPEESRDRYLQPEEMQAFFRSLAAEPNETMRDLFLACLLTGARRKNVMEMKWADVNFQQATWRIPKTKNHEAVIVTLSPPAVELLKLRHRDRNGYEYVFPGRGKNPHITEPKTAWDRIRHRAGIPDLRIHDLRRSLGSWQANSGVSLGIIGKSLGHKSQQSTAIYARLDLDPVRQATEAATVAMLESGGFSVGQSGLIEDKQTEGRKRGTQKQKR